MTEPDWSDNRYPQIDYNAYYYYSEPKQKAPPRPSLPAGRRAPAGVRPPSAEPLALSLCRGSQEKLGSLDEVDPEILKTFDKLGIPLNEQKRLSNVAARPQPRSPLGPVRHATPAHSPGRRLRRFAPFQVDAVFDSVSIATTFREELSKAGVIFCSISEAARARPHPQQPDGSTTPENPAWTRNRPLPAPPDRSRPRQVREYPDLVRQYMGSVVPVGDNYFTALNSAVFSDGSFCYIPKGVKCPMDLSTYFRINNKESGQFERTLIVAEEGAQVHYVEGCTAPIYTTNSFHSGVIEIVVKKGARVRYSTIQNWSTNVFNLVTQRSMVHEDAVMEWVDANLGSKVTMKYPSCYLVGKGAHGEILSVAFAGPGQQQDAGGKMIHFAPYTTSKITSKSISRGGGRTSFRGLLKVYNGAHGARSNAVCDALLLDPQSRSDTYPYIEIDEDDVSIGHEASVSKVGEEQLFYLMSRGLSEEQATGMVVSGFIEPLVKELPMEYAVEMNRLIQLQMEGSVG